jgi:hypothetical protein
MNRPTIWGVLSTVAVLALLTLGLAGSFASSRSSGGPHAGFETGDLRELDEASTLEGSLSVSEASPFRGRHAARARYSGSGANGYARGLFELSWQPGDRVRYSAAFRLPNGFYRAQQGQVALMRWDNWPTYGSPGADAGGIVIYGSDGRARLMRGRYGGEQVTLGRSFRLPEGRWFRLSVEQRLSTAHPFSRVELNGREIITTHQQNSYGRPINRVRFGLVAISAGEQERPLELFFDEADVSHR